MWQRTLALVFILSFIGALSALRGEAASDRFVGTWKTKENFAGYDLRTTIASEGGQWSIKGTFEKDGTVTGTFVGEKIRVADKSLTCWLKHVKKPDGTWQDHETTLRLDGDGLVM